MELEWGARLGTSTVDCYQGSRERGRTVLDNGRVIQGKSESGHLGRGEVRLSRENSGRKSVQQWSNAAKAEEATYAG